MEIPRRWLRSSDTSRPFDPFFNIVNTLSVPYLVNLLMDPTER